MKRNILPFKEFCTENLQEGQIVKRSDNPIKAFRDFVKDSITKTKSGEELYIEDEGCEEEEVYYEEYEEYEDYYESYEDDDEKKPSSETDNP